MKLVIAEKKELATHIAIALSGNKKIEANKSTNSFDFKEYKVAWCSGHILSLKDPEDYDSKYNDRNNLDNLVIKEMLRGEYRKLDTSSMRFGKMYESLYRSLPQLIKEADLIIHAGDPDDEGQAIVDNVLRFFKAPKTTPVKRVAISDVNPKLVLRAFDNMEDNNSPKWRGMGLKGRARAIADQMYGINLSRCLSAKARGPRGLSVGRVQTPVLSMVVKRYEEHTKFKPNPFFELYSSFEFKGVVFQAKLDTKNISNVNFDDKFRFLDKGEAEGVIRSIAEINNSPEPVVHEYIREEKEHEHPLVFDLLQLQVEMEEKYGIGAKETTSITQVLRDKYGVITYNRSDSQYLNEINHEDAAETLKCVDNNLPELRRWIKQADVTIKSRVWNDDEVAKSAHHGIIPTMTKVDFRSFTDSERLVYEVISRRYLLQFYPKKKSVNTAVVVSYGEYFFGRSFSLTLSEGWSEQGLGLVEGSMKRRKKKDDRPTEDSADNDLPELDIGETGKWIDSLLKEGMTTAPPLYTKVSLLEALPRTDSLVENAEIKKRLEKANKGKPIAQRGIGTPATRADIVERIFDVGYVTLDSKKKVVPTSLGKEVFDVLPSSSKKIDTTAMWQHLLGMIGDGKLSLDKFLEAITLGIEEDVNELKKKDVTLPSFTSKLVACVCGEGEARQIVFTKGKKTDKWWKCSACDSSFPDEDDLPNFVRGGGKPVTENSKGERFNCLQCDSPLALKKSNKGDVFWACTSYPKCKATYQDIEDEPRLEPCQKEGCSGVLSLLYNKKNDSFFYSCSSFRTKKPCKSRYSMDSSGKPIYIQPE